MWSNVPAIVSTLVAASGFFIAWRTYRETALRRGEVLAWSNDVIESLQSLLLICILNSDQLSDKEKTAKLTSIIFQTSVLIERGRLFFKNQVIDDWGSDKEPAYRGYRPKILDPIVVAHQIACNWASADKDCRLRMRILAEDCLKKFVSLAQKEVGRSRTASAEASKGGDGAQLPRLLNSVDEERLAKLSAMSRRPKLEKPSTPR